MTYPWERETEEQAYLEHLYGTVKQPDVTGPVADTSQLAAAPRSTSLRANSADVVGFTVQPGRWAQQPLTRAGDE